MKKISLHIYIVSLIIILLICGLLVYLILSNKQKNKSLKEESTIEETYKLEDIYIEFGYKMPVVAMVYPTPEPEQWKYTITKDGSLYYYSNFERGKKFEYDYQSKTGKIFIKKLNNETINQIENYINEKMSEAVERPGGDYYIIMNNSEKKTSFKDLSELERIINK